MTGLASPAKKIGFKSLTESIDTTTSGGKLVFHIFGAHQIVLQEAVQCP